MTSYPPPPGAPPPPPPPGGQFPPGGGGGFQSPPPSGGYPVGGYGAPQADRPKGLAVAALIFGILGFLGSFFVLGALPAIVAIILGFVAIKKIGRGEAGGKGMAITGLVLGLLGLAIAALIALTVGSFLADNADELGDYSTCIEQAGGDEAAAQACADQFNRQLNP